MFKHKSDYAEWIKSQDWELMITTRLQPNVILTQAHQQIIRQLLLPLERAARQKLTALTVLVPASPTSTQHAHTLVRGTRTNLLELYVWEYLVSCLIGVKCPLKSHTDSVWLTQTHDKIPTYIADHVLRPGAIVDHFRHKLLTTKEL